MSWLLYTFSTLAGHLSIWLINVDSLSWPFPFKEHLWDVAKSQNRTLIRSFCRNWTKPHYYFGSLNWKSKPIEALKLLKTLQRDVSVFRLPMFLWSSCLYCCCLGLRSCQCCISFFFFPSPICAHKVDTETLLEIKTYNKTKKNTFSALTNVCLFAKP